MFPYYGDVAMMKAAINSILAQSDRDFKLTIVDDGFPDDSLPAYFTGLVASDERIVYLKNEKNLGANGNYRKCVSLIEHEIVVIMGADDLMKPNYLATVRAAFENPEIDIVQPGIEVIDENGRVYLPLVDRIKATMRRALIGRASSAIVEGEPLAANLIDGNWLYFPSVAWRASAITKHNFRPGYDVVQDLALALDVIMDGGKMFVTDTICFQYRRHRESDSSVRALDGRRFVEERRFFDEKVREFTALKWTAAARAARLHATSRLNAASLIPKVVSRRMWPGLKTLTQHVVKP
jgi:glycosyltransferase involved in cell wall biosynthesis